MPCFRTIAFLFCIGAFLATQPGASCVSDTSSDDSSSSSSRPPLNDEHDDDPNYIPRRAPIVAEGRGTITWTADADGTVYVQDLKDERTIVQHRIHRGEHLAVTPDENRVRLQDDSISKDDLKKDHVHRIYVLRDRRFDDDRRGNDQQNNGWRGNDSHGDNAIDINTKDRGPHNERGVPKDAKLMDEAKRRETSFAPSVDGKVFVFDVNDSRVVATAAIGAKQTFKFSAKDDRVTVDDRRVGRWDFDPDHSYRVYFSR